jgi:hypothetical protein
MSDTAAHSEFVLVERHDESGSAGQSPAQLASDWTNVRLEERDTSPVLVNHDTHAEDNNNNDEGYDDAALSPPPQEGPPSCDADPEEELLMMQRLQKQLDEESVARFVSTENAKAASEGIAPGSSQRRCECLGASQDIHRPACPLRAAS